MIKMPRILLSGATGFLGSHLLKALLEKGYRVIVLKRSSSNIWRINELIEKVISYDVDKQTVEYVFEKHRIDIVIHTSCDYGRHHNSLRDIVESNVVFGLQVLEASLKYKVATFFNTDTLLKKNLNSYSLSKAQFVEWLRQSAKDIQVINLRIEHMYGENDDISKFVPWILSQLQAKTPEIALTSGAQQRDFIYVDDVVRAYLLLLERAPDLPGFSDFDVGTGRSITIRGFVEKLLSAYESTYGKSSAKLSFGAIPYRDGEVMKVEVDNQPLLRLGWHAEIDIDTGIQKVVG